MIPGKPDEVRGTSSPGQSAVFMVAATMLMLFWTFSTADSCVLAYLIGGGPEANPIAITSCTAGLTRGDVIIRLGALAVLSGLFALVFALVDTLRSRVQIVMIALGGLSVAGLVHLGLRWRMMGFSAGLFRFDAIAWLACAIVVGVAAAIGTAIAAGAAAEPR